MWRDEDKSRAHQESNVIRIVTRSISAMMPRCHKGWDADTPVKIVHHPTSSEGYHQGNGHDRGHEPGDAGPSEDEKAGLEYSV